MGSKQSWNTDLPLQSAVHKHFQTVQEHFLAVISAFLAICAHDMPSVRATCRSEKHCPKISVLHKLKRVGVCGPSGKHLELWIWRSRVQASPVALFP